MTWLSGKSRTQEPYRCLCAPSVRGTVRGGDLRGKWCRTLLGSGKAPDLTWGDDSGPALWQSWQVTAR
jgi:hypothetical protein